MSNDARVSVVTPFYNTAPYLAECIESVLAQTYPHFEYILVDNQSSDGSLQIAERYAARDSRVRVSRNERFVSQLENYNGGLRQIDATSKYVKLASADDVLYPEFLERTVALGEAFPSVGLVASYYVTDDGPAADGVPYGTARVPGREMCRAMLTKGCFPLGTPTTVLYRADLVRERREFYPLGHHHGDTEVAYEILLNHDMGFVHQILSFVRLDDASITAKRQAFHPNLLDLYVLLERFGPSVLSADEFAERRAQVRREYFGFLGRAALRAKGQEFWDYHKKGLATVGQELKQSDVLLHAAREAGLMALSPGLTLERVASDLKKRLVQARKS